MKKLLFFVFYYILHTSSYANPIDSLTSDLYVYSLEEQWLVYDKTLKTYLPYFPNLYGSVNKLHVNINKNEYKSLYINILGDSAASIFINHRLAYIFPKKQWLNLAMDSLQKNNKDKLLMLTYYQKNIFDKLPETYISVKPHLQLRKIITNIDSQKSVPRLQNTWKDNVIGLIGLLVLLVVAIISSVHTPLFKWSLMWKNFTNFLQARTQIKRLQGASFFWFTIFYSITLAFVLFVLSNNAALKPSVAGELKYSLQTNIYNFLFLFGSVAMTVLLKYVVVAGMGSLYFNRQSLNLHWQEYITISQIICAMLLLACLMLVSLPDSWTFANNFLRYTTIILLGLQTALITYRLSQSMSYTTTYFFAYLFSTEFLPFLVYAKIFISL
jgi:hypothetical protein